LGPASSSICSDRFENNLVTSLGTPVMAKWSSFPDGPWSGRIP